MRIVFVVFPGVTQLDFTGPAQVLGRLPDAEPYVAAGRREPIDTGCGFGIAPTATFDDCPQADLLCVPGGLGTPEAIADERLLRFVREQAARARYVTSVCTGALVLGAAGLLEGKRATTHWAYTDALAACGAIYTPGRVVVDGRLITGGGVTAGLDFAFRVAAEVAGEGAARAMQLALEYDPDPPFAGGHPDRAAPELVAKVRPRYQAQAEQLRATLAALRRAP